MVNAMIAGMASYVPGDILTNEELSKMVDTNDEWITSRVGIKTRHILKGEGLGSSKMGSRAVKKVLYKTNTSPSEIEAVICATSTPDYRFPSTASIIARKVGINNVCCYDIQAACSGFIVALQAATSYVRSGMFKKVIVVSAEKMSSITDYQDRSTCPLFGDAAASALVVATEEEYGVMDSIIHTDGVGLPFLHMKAGGSVRPASIETVTNREHFVYQEGRIVYKYAVSLMLQVSEEILNRNNLTVNAIDWFIPHQANLRIIEAIASRMEIDPQKVVVTIEKYGNTSAASIPLCLSDWEKKFKKGDKIILTSFGAGFIWGSVYLKWGYDPKDMRDVTDSQFDNEDKEEEQQ
ncbi:MAG: ketoacyl-ACP synthase III [Porphyromonadaceae bacterium]|nr:ketoacyl-ACP synthase III [Porphyromonadaceae bacterium]